MTIYIAIFGMSLLLQVLEYDVCLNARLWYKLELRRGQCLNSRPLFSFRKYRSY